MLHLITHLSLDTYLLIFQLGCLAVWKPKGVMISKKWLNNAFQNNDDGAGFAIQSGNKIEVQKGFFKFDEFWKEFSPLQKYNAIAHFRIATHGKVETNNCHPFSMCNGKYALIHNGILPIRPPKGIDESDTAHFAINILEPVIESIPWKLPAFTAIVEEAIGIGNKIVVLRNDGERWIFNEDQGSWDNKSWFSNTSYKHVWGKTTTTYGNCSQGWDHDTNTGFMDDYTQEDSPNHPMSAEEKTVAEWLREQEKKVKRLCGIPNPLTEPMIEC